MYESELEVFMYPAVNVIKGLAQSIRKNPRDLLAGIVHSFLDDAEKPADAKNEEMMRRVFLCCRLMP